MRSISESHVANASRGEVALLALFMAAPLATAADIEPRDIDWMSSNKVNFGGPNLSTDIFLLVIFLLVFPLVLQEIEGEKVLFKTVR